MSCEFLKTLYSAMVIGFNQHIYLPTPTFEHDAQVIVISLAARQFKSI